MASRIVTLSNARDEKFHCILEEPEGRNLAPVAAVLLCPGVKTRIAPHRLYRKLLGPFLERGIAVMRVDFAGLGDSEGEWSDPSLEAIYGAIERGRCMEEVRCAFDWLEANLGVRRFIAGGLCGAASTALHVAAQDERLVALYAIGLPPALPEAEGEAQPGRAQLRAQCRIYLRKLMQPRSWLRFLSFRSDYRRIARLLVPRLRARRGRPAAGLGAPAALAPSEREAQRPAAFLRLLASGRSALLIYGESDPLRAKFEDEFMQPPRTALEPYRRHLTYVVIPGANHILGEPAAIAEANRLTALWLDGLPWPAKWPSAAFRVRPALGPRAAQARG